MRAALRQKENLAFGPLLISFTTAAYESRFNLHIDSISSNGEPVLLLISIGKGVRRESLLKAMQNTSG